MKYPRLVIALCLTVIVTAAAGASGATAGPRVMVASPSHINFGRTDVGTDATWQMVTITNNGTVGIWLLTPYTHTDFWANASSGCSNELLPGDTCFAYVYFHPTTTGRQKTDITMTFWSGLAGTEQVLSIAAMGTGI